MDGWRLTERKLDRRLLNLSKYVMIYTILYSWFSRTLFLKTTSERIMRSCSLKIKTLLNMTYWSSATLLLLLNMSHTCYRYTAILLNKTCKSYFFVFHTNILIRPSQVVINIYFDKMIFLDWYTCSLTCACLQRYWYMQT